MATVTRTRFLHGRQITLSGDRLTASLSYKIWKEVDGVVSEMTYPEIVAALATQGVAHGASHPDAALAHLKCTGFSNDTPPNIFANEITAHFELPEETTTPDNIDEFLNRSNTVGDPLGPEFEWDSFEVQWFPTTDLDGKPFVTTAGEPFLPPPHDVTISVGRVTVNRLAKPNTDNSNISQGRMLLKYEKGRSAFHVNKTTGARTMYHIVTWEVWKHPFRDWKDFERPNAGFLELVVKENNEIKLEPARAPGGDPLNRAVLLTEGGQMARPNDPPIILKFRMRTDGTIVVPHLSHLF